MYRIIFMGTPDFAVETLRQIYESDNEIIFCVSQADKPAGRDLKLKPTPVKEFCLEHNIKILQPEKIRKNEEFLNEIRNAKPDIIVVVAYGKILPKELLEIPRLGCINVHGSLLPKYRGAAPIQWSVINGDEKTGVTTMYMDEGMDTGDMLLQDSFDIDFNDTYGIVYDKMKVMGGKLLIKTLNELETITPIKQSDEFTIAPMIEKSLGKLDFSKSAIELHNLIRGLNPMPGAFFSVGENVLKVWETDVKDENTGKEAGTIIKSNDKEGFEIQTGNGILVLKVIQGQNGKRMDVKDYLRGHKIENTKVN